MDFDIAKLIAWLEGRAANTDTDPRWLAARELRRAVELDLMPTIFTSGVRVPSPSVPVNKPKDPT